MKGRVNSFQSLGAVDGPGIRCVVFMQGCPLRCHYCHNPETWEIGQGESWFSVEEMIQKISRFESYIREGGGVTLSGGEPLLQWEFAAELFSRLQKLGIHTALDTSGHGSLLGAEAVLKNTDLVLCDLKFSTEEQYEQYSGGSLNKVKEFLELTEKGRVPLWIRHVVVPGLNDEEEDIRAIGKIAQSYSNLEKLELLPFHKICLEKYERLGLDFPLLHHPECSPEKIRILKNICENNIDIPNCIR